MGRHLLQCVGAAIRFRLDSRSAQEFRGDPRRLRHLLFTPAVHGFRRQPTTRLYIDAKSEQRRRVFPRIPMGQRVSGRSASSKFRSKSDQWPRWNQLYKTGVWTAWDDSELEFSDSETDRLNHGGYH